MPHEDIKAAAKFFIGTSAFLHHGVYGSVVVEPSEAVSTLGLLRRAREHCFGDALGRVGWFLVSTFQDNVKVLVHTRTFQVFFGIKVARLGHGYCDVLFERWLPH